MKRKRIYFPTNEELVKINQDFKSQANKTIEEFHSDGMLTEDEFMVVDSNRLDEEIANRMILIDREISKSDKEENDYISDENEEQEIMRALENGEGDRYGFD